MEKAELLDTLEDSHEKFMALLDEFSDEEMSEPHFANGWSLKDIVNHLTMWEAQLITLLWQATRGRKPQTAHFEKESVDALNQRWQTEMRDRPLEMALEDFYNIREQTIRRVDKFTEEELSNPTLYPWLKKKPLWQWIMADTVEHQEEHGKAIQAWLAAHSRENTPNDL